MRFITEMELRSLYKDKPFTTYELKANTKLTPGGRQFLFERGVKIKSSTEGDEFHHKNIKGNIIMDKKLEKKTCWQYEKLISTIRSVEALYYQIGGEYLHKDVILAEYIINIGQHIANIRNALEKGWTIEEIPFEGCQGITLDNFSYSIGDCFDITDFHLKLERGPDIIALHRLRCSLHQVKSVILELYEYDEEYEEILKDIMEGFNRLISTLSQKICSLVGGKVCQRKI